MLKYALIMIALAGCALEPTVEEIAAILHTPDMNKNICEAKADTLICKPDPTLRRS